MSHRTICLSMIQTIDDISQSSTQVNLKTNFPRSYLSILKRSFWWLLAYLLTIVHVLIGYWQVPSDPESPGLFEMFQTLSFYSLFIGFIIIALKALYEIFYFINYHYEVKTGHIAITQGVFFKQRSTFPIALISDVSLDRDLISFFLGLYDLYISTPSGGTSIGHDNDTGGAFPVTGLSIARAVKLQDYINRLVLAESEKSSRNTPPPNSETKSSAPSLSPGAILDEVNEKEKDEKQKKDNTAKQANKSDHNKQGNKDRRDGKEGDEENIERKVDLGEGLGRDRVQENIKELDVDERLEVERDRAKSEVLTE